MGSNSVEIPVERVEARILPDGPIANLKPEYIYPVFESTAQKNNLMLVLITPPSFDDI